MSESILPELIRSNIYREQICANLSIQEANNLRQVLHLKNLECSYVIPDKDHQNLIIREVNDVTTQIYETISQIGTISAVNKIFLTKDAPFLKSLLKLGLNPNLSIKFIFGPSPLIYHVINNRSIRMLKLLIKFGADLNIQKSDGTTPLIFATKNNAIRAVKTLVRSGAEINLVDSQNRNALNYAIYFNYQEIINYLIKYGANILSVGEFPGLNLVTAAEVGNVELVEYLLDHGLDIESTDSSGVTALLQAIYSEQIPVIKLLLSRGANPRVKTFNEDTTRSVLRGVNDPEIIKLIKNSLRK